MPEVAQTNVTPSYEIEFGVCITGRPSSEEMESAEYTTVKDAESGISGDYMMGTISIPFDIGSTMSITAQKVLEKI